ncbi:hypothetical protein LJR225_003342 [Phenylobacterium sp. LjRoot225]|uniref:hypothetical protein n=1 Tax=Phenylobacterium sp. LjRoot225 TaxID=3342285 RepID=UPI003ECF050B
MTLLLWGLGLALLALVARRQWSAARAEMRALRWSYPVGLFCDETAPIASPAAQPAGRTGLHAGAAILAVALALDVSAASQAWSPPSSVEAIQGGAALEPLQVFEDQSLDLSAYGAGSWSAATLATDGWFV